MNVAVAFSPSSTVTNQSGPVAMVALIKPKMESKMADVLETYDEEKSAVFLKHSIKNLRFFTESIGERRVVICTYDIPMGTDPDQCWAGVHKDEGTAAWLKKINYCITAHPRVAGSSEKWVRCETICKIRPLVPARVMAPSSVQPTWHAAITELKKEKEAEYRTLHQTVWPGVIDAIGNSGIPRFDIFLTELGDQVFIFYLFEHKGKNFKNQMAGMARDPSTRRWWSFTDKCQQPLPSAARRKEIWEPMETVESLNDIIK